MVLEKVENIRNNIIVLCHAKEMLETVSSCQKNRSWFVSSVEKYCEQDKGCHVSHCAAFKVALECAKSKSCGDDFCKTKHCSNTKRYIAHQSKCKDENCELCVPMKEKYYHLAFQAARDKARDLLNKLRKIRKEQLDKIYEKFESTTDAIVTTDFNYQANYANCEKE